MNKRLFLRNHREEFSAITFVNHTQKIKQRKTVSTYVRHIFLTERHLSYCFPSILFEKLMTKINDKIFENKEN